MKHLWLDLVVILLLTSCAQPCDSICQAYGRLTNDDIKVSQVGK